MNYLYAQPDRYERIPDPFARSIIKARICFRILNNYLDKKELTTIMEDKNFLFIHNNIIYFAAA